MAIIPSSIDINMQITVHVTTGTGEKEGRRGSETIILGKSEIEALETAIESIHTWVRVTEQEDGNPNPEKPWKGENVSALLDVKVIQNLIQRSSLREEIEQ